ncbi:MAG: GIY-YIG nuclease family protein [Bacteroidota bacterium]
MVYYVYILYSPSTDSYYKGQTYDLHERLTRHNGRREKATQNGVPWQLVWSTTKESRGEALLLEKKLKNLSREKTKRFIKKYS